MSANRGTATLEGLIREILGVAREVERARAGALQEIENDFKTIGRRDYGGCLSDHFSRRDLQGIFGVFRKALPELNHGQFKVMGVPDLGRVASTFGANFRANPYKGPAGRSLRGFYVEREALKQPLIVVNTAHHPLAVTSAFWHEMGHHLTARLLHPQRLSVGSGHFKTDHSQSVRLSFGNDFHEQLNNPMELAADVLVSLVAYPKEAAQRLFGALLQKGSVENIHEILSGARIHLQSVSGFNFDKQTGAAENLHYLAGMIHFAKLRLALLAGYDI